MDDIDRAQAYQAAELRRLIAAHAYALPMGEAAGECVVCGDPIPRASRLAVAGCVRCIGCQQRHEAEAR